MTDQEQHDAGYRDGLSRARRETGWTRSLEQAYVNCLTNAGPYYAGFVAGVRDVHVPPRTLQPRPRRLAWEKRASGLWYSTDGYWQIQRQTFNKRPTWYVYDSRPPATAVFAGQATTLRGAKAHVTELLGG